MSNLETMGTGNSYTIVRMRMPETKEWLSGFLLGTEKRKIRIRRKSYSPKSRELMESNPKSGRENIEKSDSGPTSKSEKPTFFRKNPRIRP